MQRTDVAILGGGLAGLCLARQLRDRLPDAAITVVDRRTRLMTEQTGSADASRSSPCR